MSRPRPACMVMTYWYRPVTTKFICFVAKQALPVILLLIPLLVPAWFQLVIVQALVRALAVPGISMPIV